MRYKLPLYLLAFMLGLAALVLFPQLDVLISGWFYEADRGFFLADQPLLVFLHDLAYIGSRMLGVVLVLFTGIAAIRNKPFFNIDKKGWLFTLLALLLGPALIANIILKDNWGRARPHEVIQFGGASAFSPPLIPQPSRMKNESFVAGDPAFGFYFSSFAYLFKANRKRSRRIFWGGILIGVLFGIDRILMGAHFFSDVLFAAFFMLLSGAILHALMYGKKRTINDWQNWLFIEGGKNCRIP